MKISPSGSVADAWHCFLLLPKLYYQFCDKILPSEVAAPRIIDHNPRGAEEEDSDDRYTRTLRRYERVFGVEPPSLIWEELDEKEDAEEEEDGFEGLWGKHERNVRKRARHDE